MLKYTLLLLLLAVLGCGSVQRGVGLQVAPPIDYTSYVYRVNDPDGHGSGWAFDRVGEWTYLATAKHVAERIPHGQAAKLEWFQSGIRQYTYADVYKIHASQDVAVLRTRRVLQMIPLSDRLSFSALEQLFSVGYGRDIYPPLVTVGRYYGCRPGEIFHTASVWFGFSGGPLIDENGFAIGVNVRIYGDKEGALSNRVGAVPVSYVRELMLEVYRGDNVEPKCGCE